MESTKTLKRVLAAGALLATVLATSAQAYDRNATDDTTSRCERARLSAWFDRQRQLTEGDTDPYKMIAQPAECAAKRAGAQARETVAYDSNRANASRSSDAMSDTAQYSMPARRQ